MRTTVVGFPFELFGGGGAGAGAALVLDEFREILADNRRERVPTRARAYTRRVRIQEFALPVYDELSALGDSVLVVQFDAHLDIHHFHDCTAEPSHGNFLLHCDGPLPPLINVGHRELLLIPDYIRGFYRQTFSAAELAVDPTPAVAALQAATAEANRVFLDFDCDVLDPAFFPATTQPVPFGLSPALLLRLVEAAWTPKVAGLLVSEFDPGRDRDDRSLAALVWLLEYLLLRRYEQS
jgi:arginase family enzyme